jgi:hypothetical protein
MVSESNRVPRSDETSIRTFTGRRFWPLNPIAEEICIEDIAHALSLICRFTGHTYGFYSVADHSLRVSKAAEQAIIRAKGHNLSAIRQAREVALWGLLHDASEAYLCDVPSPLKRTAGFGQIYKCFEHSLMQVIAERFELWPDEPAVVKGMDRVLLNTEMRDLMSGALYQTPTLDDTIFPLDPRTAEAEFLHRFEALTLARKAERAANTEAEVMIATELAQVSRETVTK